MPTRLARSAATRVPKDIIDAWRMVPSAVAADKLNGRCHADARIRPIRPFAPGATLVGSAITAWCEPADYGPVHHAIAVGQPGDVIVVAAGGRSDAAMIGELLSGAARRKGIAGVLVDGAVRDVNTLAQWTDFPVFTRWITPRGPSSMERGRVNDTIIFGGITVSPFDIVIGDDDGLVIVPQAVSEKTLALCLAHVAAERAWETALNAGATTIDTFSVPHAIADV
jgi:4-hydroxy-4-methyl-2-oxoglutarate aldolase